MIGFFKAFNWQNSFSVSALEANERGKTQSNRGLQGSTVEKGDTTIEWQLFSGCFGDNSFMAKQKPLLKEASRRGTASWKANQGRKRLKLYSSYHAELQKKCIKKDPASAPLSVTHWGCFSAKVKCQCEAMQKHFRNLHKGRLWI